LFWGFGGERLSTKHTLRGGKIREKKNPKQIIVWVKWEGGEGNETNLIIEVTGG